MSSIRENKSQGGSPASTLANASVQALKSTLRTFAQTNPHLGITNKVQRKVIQSIKLGGHNGGRDGDQYPPPVILPPTPGHPYVPYDPPSSRPSAPSRPPSSAPSESKTRSNTSTNRSTPVARVRKHAEKHAHKMEDKSSFHKQEQLVKTMGKAAAVQRKFPGLVSGIKPICTVNVPDQLTVAQQSLIRAAVPALISSETVPMYYNYLVVYPGMAQKYFTATALTATTNVVATWSAIQADPLVAALSNLVGSYYLGPFCVRCMNSTSFMTQGGEMLMGSVPGAALGNVTPPTPSTVSWAALQSYITMAQCPFPHNPDMCGAFVPQTSYDTTFVSTLVGIANPLCSAFILACRSPNPQALDVQIISHYLCNVLPGYQAILNADTITPDVSAFVEASSALKSIPPISSSDGALDEMWKAAKMLGGDVVNYIKENSGGILSTITGLVSRLMAAPHTERVIRSLSCIDDDAICELALLREKRVLPVRVLDALSVLYEYKFLLSDTKVVVKHARTGTVFRFEQIVNNFDEFGALTSVQGGPSESTECKAEVLDERHDDADSDFPPDNGETTPSHRSLTSTSLPPLARRR